MPRPYLLLALCLLFTAAAPALAGALDGLMSRDEQAAMGLDDLTPAEQAALAAWLRARGLAGAAPQPQPEPAAPARPAVVESQAIPARPAAPASTPAADDFGAEQLRRPAEPAEQPSVLRARVVGDFRGWEGKTVFRLDNGQVWRQRTKGRYYLRTDSPLVEISKGRVGYWLEVVETGRKVGVKRVN